MNTPQINEAARAAKISLNGIDCRSIELLSAALTPGERGKVTIGKNLVYTAQCYLSEEIHGTIRVLISKNKHAFCVYSCSAENNEDIYFFMGC